MALTSVLTIILKSPMTLIFLLLRSRGYSNGGISEIYCRQTLHVHINHLRQKLGDDPKNGLDLMNELLNCLNSVYYDIFDEDFLNELPDSRDSAPFDTE